METFWEFSKFQKMSTIIECSDIGYVDKTEVYLSEGCMRIWLCQDISVTIFIEGMLKWIAMRR